MTRNDAIRDLEEKADAMERLYSLLTKDETLEDEFWGAYAIDEIPQTVIRELARLAAKLERAMEGLEHYADKRRWRTNKDPFRAHCVLLEGLSTDKVEHGYDHARQAIEEIKSL